MDIPGRLNIPSHEFRVVIGTTRVEYDPDKEDANRKKHGYSLLSAVHLLERLLLPLGSPVPHAIRGPFHENGEVRHMHLTLDDSENVVVMVTTMRPQETVRVISLRRASDAERAEFEGLIGGNAQ